MVVGRPAARAGCGCSPVTLIEGSTFCISEPGGDIVPDRSQGLFVRDTRMLSRWELTVDGIEPQPLSVQHAEPFAASFLGRMPPRAGKADSTLLVIRRRYVGDGMREDITLRNTSGRAKRFRLELTAEADFADLFEVKGRSKPRAAASAAMDDSGLVITSGRRERRQELRITGDQSPSVTDNGALSWLLSVPGHAERDGHRRGGPGRRWRRPEAAAPARPRGRPHAARPSGLRKWRQRGPAGPHARPQPRRGARPQRRRPRRAAHLRPGASALAGGSRGRALVHGAVRPGLAADRVDAAALGSRALRSARCARWLPGRAATSTPRSEEEPGKILHEVRFGPAASFALGGRSAYYGSADATPLFVMLLGELQRWGGKDNAIASLLPHADRALEWIEAYGDADGDGFVEYCRKTSHGLVNQGWKDSWDGINFADGTIAEAPIALAEVQAYVYAAYRARAQLARTSGDERGAAATGGRRPSSSSGTSTSVLAARPGLVRGRPGSGQAADRLAHLEHRALPVDRHCRQGQGVVGGTAPDVRRDVQRLGHPDAGQLRWARTTR